MSKTMDRNMNPASLEAGRPGARTLAVLAMLVALPGFAILPGWIDGEVAFILYREPKGVTIQILGWWLLALLAWRNRRLVAGACRAAWAWPFRFLALLIALGGVSVLWTAVPENLLYEISQWVLLWLLAGAVLAWNREDRRVARLVRGALLGSTALLVAFGFLQGVVELPWLRSIDPGYGVRSASFLGYKNPAALAVLGQIFFLVRAVVDAWYGHRPSRWLWTICLAGELLYLGGLQSRSSLLGLAVGSLVLAGGLCWRLRRRGALAAGSGLLLATTLFLLPAGPREHQRWRSMLSYLAEPAAYLESDRGVYLRNTLNMVRHRPLGVGLGDWQSAYPVYRAHHRDLAFLPEVQVRRAHSDPVQMLGELGWPGLCLWLGFVGGILWIPWRHFRHSGELAPLLNLAQLTAVFVASATDYWLEMPFGKFHLMLGCAIVAMEKGPLRSGRSPREVPAGRWAVAGLAAVALAVTTYQSLSVRRLHHAASARALHQRLPLTPGEEQRQLLRRLEGIAGHFYRLPGHDKTLYQSHLIFAEAAERLGNRSLALERVRRALRLHPFQPNAFAWLARILEREATMAAEFLGLRDYIFEETVGGFERAYPSFFERGPKRWLSPGDGRSACRWAQLFAGRALSAEEPRGTRVLRLCGDGRFYEERSLDSGPASLRFGFWRVAERRGEAGLETWMEGSPVYREILARSAGGIRLEDRPVSIWESNGVCD